ncbi:MAG: glycoside hydrolase family 32 protein [Actinomycetota bacterium]|nr:glycoside hydrolase family 32 protein [Actinomycetota bacterium]
MTWFDGRYQLFFQFNPTAPQWTARMCWGQTESPDLLRWSAPRIALAPGPDLGCWSGAVVVDGGRPTIVYTSVSDDNWDRGRIMMATGDASFGAWIKEPAAVLEPPPGRDVLHFRDPYLWRTDDGWSMVVGAGLEPATGAVLGYTSSDLRNWEYRGVVCSRPADLTESVWTGSVWECPQLFELDGAWVLVVSVAHQGLTRHVAYSVGDFDGSTFTPVRWHRLLHGDSSYATTTFIDAAGRRCALSWSREDGPVAGREWAGALSAPLVLRRDGDRVLGAPHPDVDGLRTAISTEAGIVRLGSAPFRRCPVEAQSDVVLAGSLSPADELDVALLQGTGPVLTLALSGDTLTLRRPGRPDEQMPLGVAPDGGFELRLLLDAGIAEVFTPGGAAGVRIIPAAPIGELVLTVRQGQPTVERLVVYGMRATVGAASPGPRRPGSS